MDENWLQVREYSGDGFRPLVFFESWRVAILNYLENIHPARNDTMERHTATDEVFVLLRGKGILLIGGNGSKVGQLFPQIMEPGTIYNVRQNAWHTILLTRDASVLLVENEDTGEQNSEYFHLPDELQKKILEIARREEIGI